MELVMSGSDENGPTLDSSSLNFAMMPHNLNFSQQIRPLQLFKRQSVSSLNFPECGVKQPMQVPGPVPVSANLNRQTLYQLGYTEEQIGLSADNRYKVSSRVAKNRKLQTAKERSTKTAGTGLNSTARQSQASRQTWNVDRRTIQTSCDKMASGGGFLVYRHRGSSAATMYPRNLENRINTAKN